MKNWSQSSVMAIASLTILAAATIMSGCSGGNDGQVAPGASSSVKTQATDPGYSDHQVDRIKVGTYEFFVYKNDKVISRWMKSGRMWEGETRNIVAEFGRGDPMNVLDIGAYIGTFAIPVATLPRVDKVYAFEPMTIGLLKKNIEINQLQSKIVPYGYGVGKEEGVLHVKQLDYDEEANFGGQSLKAGHEEKAREASEDLTAVRIITIDSLNLKNIGFVKMDVEGMELEVLEGMGETIRANGLPPIMVEIWGTVDWRKKHAEYYSKNARDIHEKLLSFGYDKALNLSSLKWNSPSWPERDGNYVYVKSDNPADS